MQFIVFISLFSFCFGFWLSWKLGKSIQRDIERFKREHSSMEQKNEFHGYFKYQGELEKIYEIIVKMKVEESEAVNN